MRAGGTNTPGLPVAVFLFPLLGDGTGRARLGTVSAGLTDAVLPVFSERCLNDIEHTGFAQSDGMTSGHLGAGAHTALTVNAQFRMIAQERMAVLDRGLNLLSGSGKGALLNAIFIAEILKLACPVLRAGKTASVMVGQEQVQNQFSCGNNLLTHGLDLHALFDQSVAGWHQFLHALHFYHTDTAGADLIDFF